MALYSEFMTDSEIFSDALEHLREAERDVAELLAGPMEDLASTLDVQFKMNQTTQKTTLFSSIIKVRFDCHTTCARAVKQ